MKTVMIRAEKTYARNLEPGDLFVFDKDMTTDWFNIEMDLSEVALPIYVRTNLDITDVTDSDMLVVRIHIMPVFGDGPRATMDPHSPPGAKR